MADQHTPEQEFINKLQARLRQSEKEIDDATATRLHQARRVALDALPSKAGPAEHRSPVTALQGWQNWMLPMGGVAATLVISIFVFKLAVIAPEGMDLHESETLSVVDDIAILVSPDDLELYQDLEFYEWLTYSKALDKV